MEILLDSRQKTTFLLSFYQESRTIMTIRHLNIFFTVAQCGSMSGAARILYLSQPTVSQAIHELETHYGGLLFERLGKKLYLTELGDLLLSQAEPLLSQFQQMEELLASHGKTPTLRLGTTITVGTCLTPAFLAELRQQLPDLECYSYVSNTADIERKLLCSELDAAVVEGEVRSHDLVVLPMISDCLVLAAGTRHPFYQRDTISFHDLSGEAFAVREQGSGTRQLFERTLSDCGISVRTVCEANSPRAIINTVLAGPVLSVMSLRLLKHELRHGTVRAFYNESGAWDRSFKLVYHKNKFLTPAIQELKTILRQNRELNLPEGIGKLTE